MANENLIDCYFLVRRGTNSTDLQLVGVQTVRQYKTKVAIRIIKPESAGMDHMQLAVNNPMVFVGYSA